MPGVATATAALSPTQLTLDRNSTLAAADIGWFVVQFAGGDGFKVGSFTKAPGGAPASQAIAHGLGEVPKALILWTQGRPDETFSSASGITFRGAATGSAVSGVTDAHDQRSCRHRGQRRDDRVDRRSSEHRRHHAARRMDSRAAHGQRGRHGELARRLSAKSPTTGEPASYTWTLNTSTGSAGGIQSFSGVDVTNPFDIESGASTGQLAQSHAAPSVTTTSANDMIVTSHAFSSRRYVDAARRNDPGVRRVMSDAVPNALGMSVVGSYAVQAAVGATGTKTAAASNDADAGNTHTLALRAAPAGTAYFGFGMTDGTTSRSVSTSSQDGAADVERQHAHGQQGAHDRQVGRGRSWPKRTCRRGTTRPSR